jgi:protein TonB
MIRTGGVNQTRFIIFAVVALVHLLMILFFAFSFEVMKTEGEAPVTVMKVLDLEEEIPLPPPPPEPVREIPRNAVESIAETIIETEEEPDQTVMAPGSLTEFTALVPGEEEYLPMSKISAPPVFNEREILRNLMYPAIARRAGIEGVVYLELIIDSKGVVQRIRILREDPSDRGFGEAAVKAFEGQHCTPAESNGRAVGVYYRYPIRFQLRG